MPPQREPTPFTDEQLKWVERGGCSGRERRLLATIRQREQLKHDEASASRIDELSREVVALRGQLERLSKERDTHRVFILADSNDSIEVYADPQVRLQVGCLPESHGQKEFNEALEFVLRDVPESFKNIVHETGIRPEVFSIKCLSRGEYRYAVDRLAAKAYIEKLGESVDGIVKQKSALSALPPSDDLPF